MKKYNNNHSLCIWLFISFVWLLFQSTATIALSTDYPLRMGADHVKLGWIHPNSMGEKEKINKYLHIISRKN